jgi:hypothetical protein
MEKKKTTRKRMSPFTEPVDRELLKRPSPVRPTVRKRKAPVPPPPPPRFSKNLQDAIQKHQDVGLVFYSLSSSQRSFVDIGPGISGVVGQGIWEVACENLHVVDNGIIKELPPRWQVHRVDARQIRDHFDVNSVEIVQACRFLSELSKDEGKKFLDDCKAIARKWIFLLVRDAMWSPRDLVSAGFEVAPWRKDYILAALEK